jgi:hypothetical protein
MRVRSRLTPLLALRQRRVTQAMQFVESCNREVREKESARDAARATWTQASNAWRKQQQASVDQVASHLHQDVSSNGLAVAATRCDWWRARVAECLVALDTAQAALVNAEAVAARARKDYLRAHTRYEALVTLAANRQSEERRRYERVDSVELGE